MCQSTDTQIGSTGSLSKAKINRNVASEGNGTNMTSPSNHCNASVASSTTIPPTSLGSSSNPRRRRRQRDRQQEWIIELSKLPDDKTQNGPKSPKTFTRIVKKKKKSSLAAKHGNDSKSGGMDALIPSLIGLVLLVFIVLGRMGFRGRATVAGIDLGTTNSVICVQSPSKGVGEIVCIPDPLTNSPVIPSVVSFYDDHHLTSFRLTTEEKQAAPQLMPHPIDVAVGKAAKDRIDTHPHHTVYHAKRVIGRSFQHESVKSLKDEVDFEIVSSDSRDASSATSGVNIEPVSPDKNSDSNGPVAFSVPYHLPPSSINKSDQLSLDAQNAILNPSQIGSYIVHHLRTITRNHLQHDNVQSAVIAIPAKFERSQRDATIKAFELAGMKVARVLEEPTAAALAYGLHKRDDVHHVLVYDFGGGTLDVSLLYVGEGGYIEVLGSDGDEQLGGADFDAAVAHYLERNGAHEVVKSVMASIENIEKGLLKAGKRHQTKDERLDVEDMIEEFCPKLKKNPLCTKSSLHTIGERIKIALSNLPNDPEASVEDTCFGLPPHDTVNVPSTVVELCASTQPIKFSLTIEEYDHAADHLYKRSVLPIRRLLNDLNLQKGEIDEVVMVGGTTRMPQIREIVRKELEKDNLNTHIDPDLTVAYGAASVID